jgi:hypothetical protein
MFDLIHDLAPMQRSSYMAIAFVLVALAATPCAADPPDRPARPYTAVAITLPPSSADPGFAAFRQRLAGVATTRIYSELTSLVAQDFFWGRDFAGRFDPRRSAVDNLAAAIRLEHAGGSGWQALAAFAADSTAEPLVSRPGVVCAPAPPLYDAVAFARMLDEAHGAEFDWTYPLKDQIPVLVEPEMGAASVDVLGLHFVRRLGFSTRAGRAASDRNLWARIVTPAGLVGFAPPGSLMALKPERLCYAKDTVGRWHIAGFIGGTN